MIFFMTIGCTAFAEKYDMHIIKASQKFGIPRVIIRNLIFVESSNNPKAKSKKGAHGLMQLRYIAAKEMGVRDRYNPKQNIIGGTKYLKKMWDRFDSLYLALIAYNLGPTKLSKIIREGGIIPVGAIRYANKIMSMSYPSFKKLMLQG